MKTKKHMAPKRQTMPDTPPSKKEMATSRPANGRKVQMPPKPQPVAQNTNRKKGVR